MCVRGRGVLLTGSQDTGKTFLARTLLADLEANEGIPGGWLQAGDVWAAEEDGPGVRARVAAAAGAGGLLVVDDLDELLTGDDGPPRLLQALERALSGGGGAGVCPGRNVHGVLTALCGAGGEGAGPRGWLLLARDASRVAAFQARLFDCVLTLTPPTRDEREAFLRAFITLSLPGDQAASVCSRAADGTGGFAVGDLVRLCRTAALKALIRGSVGRSHSVRWYPWPALLTAGRDPCLVGVWPAGAT
jgi:hypothetical protein